jgi:Arc/MetJ-type ribon-helix-helix transcriptional regulator
MTQQLVTRVDDALLAEVDVLVAQGTVASRSEAVRRGLRVLVDAHHRAQVGAAIAESYRSRPQESADLGWADDATRRMIADESW